MSLHCMSRSHYVSDMRWNFNRPPPFHSPWSILFPSVGGLKVRLLKSSDSSVQSAQEEKKKGRKKSFSLLSCFSPLLRSLSLLLTALRLPLRLSNCSGQSKYPLAKVNRLNDKLLNVLLHLLLLSLSSLALINWTFYFRLFLCPFVFFLSSLSLFFNSWSSSLAIYSSVPFIDSLFASTRLPLLPRRQCNACFG